MIAATPITRQLISQVERDARIEHRLRGAERDEWTIPTSDAALRRLTNSAASIAADRTAGVGAPINAT